MAARCRAGAIELAVSSVCVNISLSRDITAAKPVEYRAPLQLPQDGNDDPVPKLVAPKAHTGKSQQNKVSLLRFASFVKVASKKRR